MAARDKYDIHELRRSLLRLRDEILMKPEDARTQLDGILIESALALADALLRYERSESTVPAKSANNVGSILRAYNEIHHQKAIADADAEAIETFRNRNGREE